jgi:Short-chain alcohol dehydrogenase of unknown specificity
MTRLKGKVALITGGASGIGEATVRLFVEEGASVMVADIQDDRGKRLADELGARAGYVHTDVSQESHVKAAVEETCRRFGRLDCIFNNAGYGGVGGKIEDVSADGFDATIGVLLRGVFLGMKHAAPVMKKQGAGSIISTASVAGLRTGLGPTSTARPRPPSSTSRTRWRWSWASTASGSIAYARGPSPPPSSASPWGSHPRRRTRSSP